MSRGKRTALVRRAGGWRGALGAGLLAAVVGACLPTAPLTTVDPAVEARIRAVCSTALYRNCIRDALEVAMSSPPGTLVLICDLGDGNGKAATTLSEMNADRDCTEGGRVPDMEVVAVIRIP